MAPFRVLLDHRAEREFQDLPADVRQRFYAVFEELEEDPYRPRPGCDIRMVKGHGRVRAVRVGSYRGFYEVVENEVRMTTFRHRKKAY